MIDASLAKPYMEYGSVAAYSDIREMDKGVVLTIELPGVEKKDIDIDASEDEIRVSVEAKKKTEVKKKGLYKAGSRYFEFNSIYTTPCPIDSKTIKATYNNGVLEVTAKKIKAKKKGVKVKVR